MIMVKNQVDLDGKHVLHLMSNDGFDGEQYAELKGQGARVMREDGVWSLVLIRPYRGPLEVELGGKPLIRRFVVAPIDGSLKAALEAAGAEYEKLFGRWPEYAWTGSLPRGVEYGELLGRILLFQADWAIRGSVMVGGEAMIGRIEAVGGGG